MSHRGKIKRYGLLLDKLRERPSLQALQHHMDDMGFPLSQRTLQRDLQDLSDEFGITTVYDRGNNTYMLEADPSELDALQQLLGRAQLLEVVQHGRADSASAQRHLRFEDLGQLQGIHHIEALLQAVRERRIVDLTHRRFGAESAKSLRIHPHFLKESSGRWYVVCLSEKHGRPIAVGLDRIETVKVLRNRFIRQHSSVEQLYADVIGVDTSPGKAERIVLRFTPAQAPYVKALPLHTSQLLLREDAEGTTIALHVMANYELRRIILGLGAAVHVLEPAHLAKAIREAHAEAAAQYGRKV